MQQKKASLCGDCETDLIRNFKAVATFETLLSKKGLNVTENLGLIAGSKPMKERDVSLDRFEPLFWKRPRLETTTLALL